ncbi:7744_t:CDS:2, partial [Entrophospora sp. SA101]
MSDYNYNRDPSDLTYEQNKFSVLPPTNNQNDFSIPPLTNNFHQHSNEINLDDSIYHHNPNQYLEHDNVIMQQFPPPPPQAQQQQNTETFPNYQNIISATTANVGATTTIADNNNMNSLVLTPLLNDPSSFYCESNNNITWLLTCLEKRINQIEESKNQRIFASNNSPQNNAFDNGHYNYNSCNIGNSSISNEDIYNLLVLTPLLNDPSSFYCESNNNITWLLTCLEKRINQIEESKNQRIFASNNSPQNNAFDNGHYNYNSCNIGNSSISNEDIYNLL